MDEIENKNKNKNKNCETMQTNDYMKVCLDTAEQFLPDQTNTIKK